MWPFHAHYRWNFSAFSTIACTKPLGNYNTRDLCLHTQHHWKAAFWGLSPHNILLLQGTNAALGILRYFWHVRGGMMPLRLPLFFGSKVVPRAQGVRAMHKVQIYDPFQMFHPRRLGQASSSLPGTSVGVKRSCPPGFWRQCSCDNPLYSDTFQEAT